MRAGTAFISTDVETGHTDVHLYMACGRRVEIALELGEANWHALHRAWDASGLAGNAHFEPRNKHIAHGKLIESYECLTVVAS